VKVRDCTHCDGTGVVEVQYYVGGYQQDRWMEIRTSTEDCADCHGWGQVVDDEDEEE
jgi:DnaJ-class molecular chaperone